MAAFKLSTPLCKKIKHNRKKISSAFITFSFLDDQQQLCAWA